jgi:hypothetical protein
MERAAACVASSRSRGDIASIHRISVTSTPSELSASDGGFPPPAFGPALLISWQSLIVRPPTSF